MLSALVLAQVGSTRYMHRIFLVSQGLMHMALSANTSHSPEVFPLKPEMGVSENKGGGTLFWGPYNKDPTIQGTILGFPYLRKLPRETRTQGGAKGLLKLKKNPGPGTQSPTPILNPGDQNSSK